MYVLYRDSDVTPCVIGAEDMRHANLRHHPLTALTTVSPRAHDAEATLRALDDGVCVVTAEWRIVFANAAFERAVAMCEGSLTSAGALEGRDLLRVCPALCEVESALREALRGGEGGAHRVRVRVPDMPRAERWLEVRGARVSADRLAIQLRDVSEVARAERELREHSEENASLRGVANALAEETDLGRLLRLICHQAAEQCHADGAAVMELANGQGVAVAGEGLLSFVPGRRHALAGSLAERAIAARAPLSVSDYPSEFAGRAFAAVGSQHGIGPLLVAPLSAHGETLGVLTAARRAGAPDFRDRERQRIRAVADQAALAIWKSRLLERAQAANQAKSDFMATMSHELRTPLTTLQGYEELMADEILGPVSEEQRQALERMRWSTQLLATIVEEILTFSDLEAGQIVVHAEPASAEDILDSVAAVLAPLAAARDLPLGVHLPAAAPRLTTDPRLLRRVLVNLGANAVKFTDEGEVELSVAADAERNEVAFTVRDTGIGIAPEDLQRLFQPFTQLDGGITRRHGGTGLGLYTASRLTALLGGRIDVRSEPGKGSEFVVVVPG